MFIRKNQSCQNNPEKSFIERTATHVPSGYSLDLVTSCNSKKSKHSYYRGTHCTEKLCNNLKDQAMKIITTGKKEMVPLTDNEKWDYEIQNYCHICRRKFCYDKEDKSSYAINHKVKDHCHYTGKFRGAAHSICNLRYRE